VWTGKSPLSNQRACAGCLEKQLKLDRMEAELRRLRDKLRYQERTAKEGPFGPSTPSSKIPIKPSSLEERQNRKGGARPGHPGRGRQAFTAEEADRVERVPAADLCPDCGTALALHELRRRPVIDVIPLRVEKQLFELERKRCPVCKCRVDAKLPGVLPRFLHGNALLAHVAVQHYLYGQTLGSVARQLGLSFSTLLQALHALARRLEPVIPKMIDAYRRTAVKHADETGWRTDGRNGYAWLFATTRLSIFRFRGTRAASVAREVFGALRLAGVLVVDRYHAYNKTRCKLQYCFAHLLRDLKDLLRKFPDEKEIERFVQTAAPLLSSAMKLRKHPLSKRQFRQQAHDLKAQITQTMNASARHPAVQDFQRIFREKADRLYHWADDPAVPADNNLAERDLRPLVIARKISFGSQSATGAKTRETLMSILHSLHKQFDDPAARFKDALDKLAQDPDLDLYQTLFPENSS
jgi:transposase